MSKYRMKRGTNMLLDKDGKVMEMYQVIPTLNNHVDQIRILKAEIEQWKLKSIENRYENPAIMTKLKARIKELEAIIKYHREMVWGKKVDEADPLDKALYSILREGD